MSVRNRKSDDDFESVRQDSLRTFAVQMRDGSVEYVIAHQHDGGSNPAGCLNFIVISPEGKTLITHTYNSHAWDSQREVGAIMGVAVPAA